MTKTELISKVSEETDIAPAVVGNIISTFCKVVIESLNNEEKIHIMGFGTFETKVHKERNGINPHTMERMIIPSFKVPRFTASQKFKDELNK